MASRGQGVRVDAEIDGQSHTVDVRGVFLCCALQRAENSEVRKN
jgi:hypothetical protein